ncbi:hypothetical protein ACIBQX_48815 [Nonomuraea sp. NPDC049714]|uniref:hypothetical protein n=1 Tax=Nonomuraea sp. NPDC049714 TaxID=3364357 RepID=UPI00379E99CE
MAIAAAVVLAASLTAGLIWFFADPLAVPDKWVEILSWRASVISMFAGIAFGLTGLVVAMVTLQAQTRAEHRQAQVSASGTTAGPATTGPSRSPEPAVSPAHRQEDPTDDHQRTYGSDHIEFHHNTFHGTVVGKHVSSLKPEPSPAAKDEDEPR